MYSVGVMADKGGINAAQRMTHNISQSSKFLEECLAKFSMGHIFLCRQDRIQFL